MKPLILSLLAATLLPAAVPIEPVLLTEQGVQNLGIATVSVEEADFELTTFALASTEAAPESRSTLSSRIPGRIIETRLRLGEQVKKGDPLVLLESRQPGDPPPAIWLTAPADGTITAIATTLGAPVEPSDRLAEIADLRTIHLVATVPQATAGKLAPDARARVKFPLFPEKEFTATRLAHPGAAIRPGTDEATLNTVGLIFTLDNPDNALRPGMSAECTLILDTRTGVMSVPREAIQGTPSSRHVYVKHMTIPHAFERVNVTTGLANQDRIEILDGLFPGDEVVTQGSYSLGYAGGSSGISLKEAMDAAHGHEHNEDGSEKTAEQQASAANEGDPHHHDHPGPQLREIFFMAATGILALALIVVSLRRAPSAEIS
jgi:multidrug efflux pump subunit AcrA (membrane-fusion protein)